MNGLIIVLLCIVSSESVLGQKEGESCVAGDKTNGVCTVMSECIPAQENLKKNIFPKICSFNRLITFVCCADPPANETIVESITEARISVNDNDNMSATNVTAETRMTVLNNKNNRGEISKAIEGVEFQFVNKEDDDIWVGTQANPESVILENGGFILNAKTTLSIGVPENWAGIIWGRSHCDPETQHCLTGDCGNKLECQGSGGILPYSRAEFTLNGYGGADYYDINLIDGFNLPLAIEPVVPKTGSSSNSFNCKKSQCLLPLNNYCPDLLKLKSEFGVIGCKSACRAFNKTEYCTGYKQSLIPQILMVKHSTYFKFNCPKVYSYPFDDQVLVYTCRTKKYIITFGI